MRHSFEKIAIPEGSDFIDIVCINCGKKIRKFRNGSRVYFYGDGTRTGIATDCEPRLLENALAMVVQVNARLEKEGEV